VTSTLGDRLEPIARSLIRSDETLRGYCVATQQSLLSGRLVAIVVTDDRLIVQGLTRRFDTAGEPLSLRAPDIAAARIQGGGTGWATVGAAILDAVSVRLELRTVEGAKLALTMMTAEGILAGAAGGETQRTGVEALGHWFADHAGDAPA
jgi:hypothetical protein